MLSVEYLAWRVEGLVFRVRSSWCRVEESGFDLEGVWSGVSDRYSSQFRDHYFAEMCSGSEEGSCVRLIDFCISQLARET